MKSRARRSSSVTRPRLAVVVPSPLSRARRSSRAFKLTCATSLSTAAKDPAFVAATYNAVAYRPLVPNCCKGACVVPPASQSQSPRPIPPPPAPTPRRPVPRPRPSRPRISHAPSRPPRSPPSRSPSRTFAAKRRRPSVLARPDRIFARVVARRRRASPRDSRRVASREFRLARSRTSSVDRAVAHRASRRSIASSACAGRARAGRPRRAEIARARGAELVTPKH